VSTVTLPEFVGCDTGGAGGTTDAELREILELELLFKATLSTSYKELTYTVNGDLSVVVVWDTVAKALKLFTRTLAYSAPPRNLISIVTLDEQTAKTLTVTLAYSGGDLASVSKAIA